MPTDYGSTTARGIAERLVRWEQLTATLLEIFDTSN